jgi:hypothetical protein
MHKTTRQQTKRTSRTIRGVVQLLFARLEPGIKEDPCLACLKPPGELEKDSWLPELDFIGFGNDTFIGLGEDDFMLLDGRKDFFMRSPCESDLMERE